MFARCKSSPRVSAAKQKWKCGSREKLTGKNHIDMASLEVSATYIPPPPSAKGWP